MTTVDPFAPARLGPIELRNRVIKAATFEGLTASHVVSDELIEFHRRMAAGGVGMTTVAYCAISREGCGTPNEIVLTPDTVPGLRKLADVVHAEGAKVSAQIGHAGAVAAATGARGRSPSRIFSPLAMQFTRALDQADITRIIREFGTAAKVVADGGFDAIEVHLGHGYLASEFLSPKLNRRTDAWGGTLEKRARFSREIVQSVRDAVGPDVAVIAKLNMTDGVPGGFWVDESVQVAKWLASDGALDAIELTGGSSLQNPMYLFRGDAPIPEMAATFPKAMRLPFKVVGPKFLHSYPYEPAFFLPMARQFRAAVDLPLVLLGGIEDRATIEQAMAEGFDFVAMGRALLREPDLVGRLAAGSPDAGLCIHCNKCMATIYTGTRCVLVDDDTWPRPAPRVRRS